jgi:hypothetical protein
MGFSEHFEECKVMNKSLSCPEECGLRDLSGIPAVWVPPPQDRPLAGMIISRDPTTAFIQYYNEARSMPLPEWREHLFHCNAISDWTFDKIERFNRKCMKVPLSPEDLENFRNTLFHSVYWTHLHKCCTDKRKVDSQNFRGKNARLCADRWLKSEIEYASRGGIRFIITLGRDVERWFDRTGNEILFGSTIKVYHLPHPSGANNGSWFPKDERKRKALEEKIREFVLNCR